MNTHAKVIADVAKLNAALNGGVCNIIGAIASAFSQIERNESSLRSLGAAVPQRPALHCTGTESDTLDDLLADADSLESHAEALRLAVGRASLKGSPATSTAKSVTLSPDAPKPSAGSVVPFAASWTEKAKAAKQGKQIESRPVASNWSTKCLAAKRGK